MIKEIRTTEPYVSSLWNSEYPKIQILTIAQLLKGERPKIPPTVSQYQDAPRIERAITIKQTRLENIS
jgi:hypothetical protein